MRELQQHSEPSVIAEFGPAPRAVPAGHAQPSTPGAGNWQGTPVASGQAQGRVHIACSPADGLGMQPGDVLAVPSTDPAWTPLFLKAGALIMETGGYLSHGAIVAREFGIPAVANLPDILSALQPGETLVVDGSRGRVQRPD
ncbi:PEP-utilizing enzyme [Bordetella petrii]|uniref:PEP-utilizing enzyme n=1 Tax=Bordetella petrii TaxID=94624 RepID=UPI001E5DD238|nr:PEP-utilizing enzyme [Bordetella petrii]MCD0502709.1 hypothetical protein [Bordetella petrii]